MGKFSEMNLPPLDVSNSMVSKLLKIQKLVIDLNLYITILYSCT